MARGRSWLLRGALSVTCGAIVGATLIALIYAGFDLGDHGTTYFLTYDLRWVWLIFTFAFIVWFVGLIVFGLLPWWLLHKFGYRSWYVAAALGFVLSFAVNMGIYSRAFGLLPQPANTHSESGDSGGLTTIDSKLTSHGWWVAARWSAVLGLVGSAVGLIVWTMAYLPQRSQPDPHI